MATSRDHDKLEAQYSDLRIYKHNARFAGDWRYQGCGEDMWILDSHVFPGEDAIEDAAIFRIDNPTYEPEEEVAEAALHNAIDQLTDKRQYIIHQHLFEGRTFRTIGEDLKVSKQYVHAEYNRSVIQLREALASQGLMEVSYV